MTEDASRDREDLEGYRRGSEARFRSVYERHFRALARVAYGVLLDASEAQDVVQEAFVKLHREAKELDAGTDVKGWLYRVTLNGALSRKRALRAWGRRVVLPSPRARPEQVTVENRAAERLRAALTGLSATQRAVLTLGLDRDLAPAEIAQVLGMSANSVRVTLHRGLQELRARLARDGIDVPFDDVAPLDVEV